MASFDAVNYSLRPSKSIQRAIVFDGVRKLQTPLGLDRLTYIGFGSIWFTDFVIAHKLMGIEKMVSIEKHTVGFRRAVFNSPFATVDVKFGLAAEVLPGLYSDEAFHRHPWMIWLDYDSAFDESLRDDARSVIESVPENSVFLLTFNGHVQSYGKPADRPKRLRDLFGVVVPDELSKPACKDGRMQETLADLAIAYMKSVAADQARPGGFVPAFRAIYKDSTPMVTVGGVLPARGAVCIVEDVVKQSDWPCQPTKPIVAPHLTLHEATVLQSQLPSTNGLSRALVQKLGFDLEHDQIESFEKYYLYYPSFAQDRCLDTINSSDRNDGP